MTTLLDVDIRLMIDRLRPAAAYRWVGRLGDKGYKSLEECIAEWRDTKTMLPTADELIVAWDSYLAEETAKQQQATSDDAKVESAKTAAKAIPNWATWNETQAVNYIQTNVTDLASARTVLIALAKMVVALRDDTWPDLGR